jgi:hypothetical protein
VVEKYKVDLNVEDRDFKQTLLSWAMLYQNPEVRGPLEYRDGQAVT